MDTSLEFSIDLARQSGALLKRFFRQEGLKTSLKADHSVVTEADLTSDALITGAIRKEYPQDGLISEEQADTAAGQLTQDQPAIWIVDPLDGTTNFSLGLHVWGVLISRVQRGWPQVSVLYFPLLDELYTAQAQVGAWMNGQPLHIEQGPRRSPMPFFVCCSRTHRHYHVNLPYKTRIMGSAAYSLCCVARGAAIIGFDSTAKIWDIVGAWHLVQEAGGQITTLDGSQPLPIDLTTSRWGLSYPTLCAATPELLQSGLNQIVPRSIRRAG